MAEASGVTETVWIDGPKLRRRWSDMPNSTFYDRLGRGLIPQPRYPFGPAKPFWLLADVQQLEARATAAVAPTSKRVGELPQP